MKLALTRGLRAAAVAALVALAYLTYKLRNFWMTLLRNRIGLLRTLFIGSAVSLLERLKDKLEFLM